MENKINIAELLKDCPKGMELDCSIWDNVVFDHIDTTSNYPIYIKKMGGELEYLTEDGHFNFDCDAKCVIFPKGKTTWEGFRKPFKDGDIVATNTGMWVGIVKKPSGGDTCEVYVGINTYYTNSLKYGSLSFSRPATEEEKQKLFDAIKANGYKWNEETKTLEKLVKPRFKVGDRIKVNCNNFRYNIKELTDTHYTLEEVDYKFKYTEPISEDKNWELVPSKFDISTLIPFESRVLTRDDGYSIWQPNVWGLYDKEHRFPYVTTGNRYRYCIPYEGNEHLLGTTDDCNEYFKTW